MDATPAAKPNRLMKTFLTGMFVCLPLLITVALLTWAGGWLDSMVRRGLPKLPPGMAALVGVAVVLSVFYLIGLLARNYAARRIGRVVEWIVMRIPLAKTLYEAARDMTQFFSGGGKFGQVVQVSLAGGQLRMLGLLTNRHPRGGGPADPDGVQRVAVYVPMSYQLGGFTIYVRPDQIQPMEMSVEQAMRVAATADMG